MYAALGGTGIVVVRHAQRFNRGTQGRIKVDAPGFVSLAVVALDDRDLERSNRILVSACGRCENTGMVFSQDRQTVECQWGHAPVLIEPVTGTVELSDGNWQAWALDPHGRRKHRAALVTEQGHTHLVMTAGHKTMWYLLERAGAQK